MNIYHAGIIGRTGEGDYGHGLDVAFADFSNIQVIAVADPDPVGLAAAGQRSGATQLYEDYHEMLAQEQLDLVAVAPRWVHHHREMIIACAEAGVRGVFCEKPMAATLADADAILAACEKSGTRLAVAHRRANLYEHVTKFNVEQGLIGEIKMMRGRGKGDHRAGGEDLFVLGTHIMDSMRYFAGSDVAWATGHVTQDGREVTADDAYPGNEGIGLTAGNAVSAYYVFKNGIQAHFESYHVPSSDSEQNNRWFGFEIYGTKGILSLRNSPSGELYLHRQGMWIPDGEWERHTFPDWEYDEDNNLRSGEERTHQSNMIIVADLMRAIAGGEFDIASSGYDARAALEMIMAVHESQRVKGRVEFPLKNRENPYQTWRES